MEQIIYTEKTDGISIDRIRRDAAFSMPRKHLHNEYEIYYLLEESGLTPGEDVTIEWKTSEEVTASWPPAGSICACSLSPPPPAS